MATQRSATLIPGDGIGPEIMAATRSVLDALGAPFVWEEQQAGMAAVETSGDPLPQPTLDSIRRTGLALKGPLTTPVGGGFRRSMSASRGVKLSRTAPRAHADPGRYENIDIVLVRARNSKDSTSRSSTTSRSTTTRKRGDLVRREHACGSRRIAQSRSTTR